MYLIIGCGRLGGSIANRLAQEGHDVTVLDHMRENLQFNLPRNFRGKTVLGMEIDTEILRKAGISQASSVMCLARDENTNMMAADVARMLFGARHVIVRIDQHDLAAEYHAKGFDVISPLGEATNALEGLLAHPPSESPPDAFPDADVQGKTIKPLASAFPPWPLGAA